MTQKGDEHNKARGNLLLRRLAGTERRGGAVGRQGLLPQLRWGCMPSNTHPPDGEVCMLAEPAPPAANPSGPLMDASLLLQAAEARYRPPSVGGPTIVPRLPPAPPCARWAA